MKFFIDSANVDEIKALCETGIVDGVTTNPSLIMQSGGNFSENLREICKVVDGPVSAEVTATTYDAMLKEGYKLTELADNIVIKVPLTPDGVRACKVFTEDKLEVNMTLCFSASQAIVAAKAGATFISPFVGRLDDIGHEGMNLISDIVNIYKNYNYPTEVLVASIRNTQHIIDAALIGASVVTVPPKIVWQMFDHPLTDSGLLQFLNDWKKTGESIL